ncbi:class I SAM-dependent methyltransferase [Oceanicoccus sp. KOV_DT_Chl]|uniref:class I SAM-dependent methyltransferase n=1 Tax=Oceanicoccus sp. KOV_DT_Chl TaxID=1904639 RepID=UPI00190EC8DE|nr:methyltransferase domain-containing protein [Oceanicoccus sp. KOV_DT_Chl]
MNQQAATLKPVKIVNPIADFWNEVLAPKFIKYKHIMVGGLSRHSELVFPALPLAPGDRVLDVGCGFGDSAIALAKRVGAQGEVVGIDCCDAFLEFGRKQVQEEGIANIVFEVGDAEHALPSAAFDLVFARFGTMFFVNPVAGLRQMRQALKPGGRMIHIVWGARADNPWLSLAKDIVLKFLPVPGSDGLSCGPGPFSMADQDHTRKLMETAGYTDIHFIRVDAPVMVGTTIREAIDFQLAIGPAGEVFREAGVLGEARRPEIEAALTDMLAAQTTTEAGIFMDSSSWVISAINSSN